MFRRIWNRIFTHTRKRNLEKEMEAEMRFHLDMEIDNNARNGMTKEEARLTALQSFGGLDQAKENYRDIARFRWIEDLWMDLRISKRSLLKKPGFTVFAIITFALGIGANTAIFSVVKAVLLEPLPYKNPEQLVMLWENDTLEGNDRNPVSPGNFGDWRNQNKASSQLAYYTKPGGVNVTGQSGPERIIASEVSANLFSILGVQPMLGSTFTPVVRATNPGLEIILSYGLWQRRFGGSTDVLGKPMTIRDNVYTIVGVMPPQFQLPEIAEFWEQARNVESQNRGSHFLRVIGRLNPEVSIKQAQSDFTVIAKRLEKQYPETNKGSGINVISFHDQFVGTVKPALLMLLIAVGFMLLIACANVANLLLVRAAARQQQITICAALGAGRWRLIRQLLTESLLLTLVGGILGFLLAIFAVNILSFLIPANLVQTGHISINPGVLAFTSIITILTGVICGIAPAWQSSKPNLHNALKESGRSSSGSLGRRRLSDLLVVAEISLTLVLLIGGVLMVKSFTRLMAVEPGFDSARLLTLEFALVGAKYRDDEQVVTGYRQLLENLAILPGVHSVGAISRLPLAGDRSTADISIERRDRHTNNIIDGELHFRVITPGYLPTIGLQLFSGRNLTENDKAGMPQVVLINETAARLHWPNENALGKRIKFVDPNAPWQTIVGVVRDARNFGLDENPRPEIYVSYLQDSSNRMRVVIRTSTESLSLVPGIRQAVNRVDRDLPISQVMTMDDLYSKSVAQRRLNMTLLGIFAFIALLLAISGIYSVVSYTVTNRTQEVGIRIAIGAQNSDVLKPILLQGMLPALIGVAIGLIAAFALTRLIKSLVFGVSVTDPIIFIVAPITIMLVTLLACYFPARRATKIDPLISLRYE